MPAHITINYPFVPGVEPSVDTLSRLSKVLTATQPFSFALDHVGRFPNVVYLAPDPSTPFVQLVEQIAQEFPESPPYGGRHRGSTPHLTVAQSINGDVLASVEKQIMEAASDQLPLRAYANRVWLMDNSTGQWERRVSFARGANQGNESISFLETEQREPALGLGTSTATAVKETIHPDTTRLGTCQDAPCIAVHQEWANLFGSRGPRTVQNLIPSVLLY